MHLSDDIWSMEKKQSLQRPDVTKMSVKKIGYKDVK
jgi:hypothetical protein